MANRPSKWKARGLSIWDVRYGIIEDLQAEELTLEEIASKHSVSFGMVRAANEGTVKWVRQLDIETFPIRLKHRQRIKKAKELIKEGVPAETIAKQLNLEVIEVVRAHHNMLKKGEM